MCQEKSRISILKLIVYPMREPCRKSELQITPKIEKFVLCCALDGAMNYRSVGGFISVSMHRNMHLKTISQCRMGTIEVD
jgi:hypothetical protein